MRNVVLRLALVAMVPTSAYAASIPLQDGEYAWEACSGGLPDIGKGYSIYTATNGKQKGSRYLSPELEGQEGTCTTGKINANGDTYSGLAKCNDGGSRIRYSTGSYKYSLKVINDRTFMSKGKKYVWCAAHR